MQFCGNFGLGGGGNIFVVMGWVRFGSTVGVCIYVRLGCQELRLVELGDGLGTGKGWVSCFFLSVRVTFWKGVGRGRREQKAGQGCRSCGKTSVG